MCCLNKKYISLYALVCITLLSSLRFQVGSDFDSYLRMFDVIANDIPHLWQNKEVGYLNLIRLVNLIGGNQQVIIFVFSVGTSLLCYYGLKCFFKDFENSRLITFAILIVFLFQIYFPSLNQIRQYAVLGIFIYSLKYYYQSKYIAYFLLMVFASSIHFTAVLVLIVSLFIKVDLSSRKYVYFIVFFILAMNPMTRIIDAYVSYQLPYYQYFIIEGLNNSSSFVSVVSGYIMLLCYILVVSFDKGVSRYGTKYVMLSNLSFVFIIVKILGADFEVINRVSNYFKVFFYLHFILFVFNLKFTNTRQKEVLVFSTLSLIVVSGLLSVILRASGDPTYSNVDFNICITGDYCPTGSYK